MGWGLQQEECRTFCAQSQSEVHFLLPLGDASDHCRMYLEGDQKSPPHGAGLDSASTALPFLRPYLILSRRLPSSVSPGRSKCSILSLSGSLLLFLYFLGLELYFPEEKPEDIGPVIVNESYWSIRNCSLRSQDGISLGPWSPNTFPSTVLYHCVFQLLLNRKC